MNTTDYDLGNAKGIVPVEKIIDSKYLAKAREYAAYMHTLTLKGNKTKENRPAEEVEKDQEAIDLLTELAEVNNPALAYGFMLYNESSITKIYWTKRVGKLRQHKADFFNQDKYLEWLTEIFAVLNGDHPKFHDPLYYYTLNGVSKRSGKEAGTFDIMNSFRTWWNMNFLPQLAKYLFAEDQKEADYGISIDAALENEDAGHHLDAELAEKGNFIPSPEDEAMFNEVEAFLREFLKEPLNSPISTNAGTKSAGVTYRDVLITIIDGTAESQAGIRKSLNLSQSVEERALARIQRMMDKYGIDLNTFGNYLSNYRTVALDILKGSRVSFRDV